MEYGSRGMVRRAQGSRAGGRARTAWSSGGFEPEPEPELEPEQHSGRLDSRESRRSEQDSMVAELRTLSVEQLKARARGLLYVNEDTLAAVDDMQNPKKYLINLLAHLEATVEHQHSELSETELSDSSLYWQRDSFQDSDLSEAQQSDTSPFLYRPQAPAPSRQPVVVAQPTGSWRPAPERSRQVFGKAQRKYDDALLELRSPLHPEGAMTLLETARRLLGMPWDQTSQELSDSIEARLREVPQRYLSDELQARNTRQRGEAATGVSSGRPLSPRSSSPQGSRARTPRRRSPRRDSARRGGIQEAVAAAYEQAEVEKNSGVALERRRDHEQAVIHYDNALKILKEHADDKRCADMTALLERKRQKCADTVLQQAGAAKAVRPSQVSPKRERHAHSQKALEALLESSDDIIVVTRELLTKWKRHVAVYDKAHTAELPRQRAGRRRPEAADVAESKYTNAVDAFNRGDDENALELVESGLELLPSSVSSDREEQKLRETMEEFRREKKALVQKNRQLLDDIRHQFQICQDMQEQVSNKAWDTAAAAASLGRGRARVSPGRGGAVKWDSSMPQQSLATTRTGLRATAKEATAEIDGGPMSARETRLKRNRERLESMLRLLRSAQIKKRRGTRGARASPDRTIGAGADGGARGPSPRRPFCNAVSKYDSSTSDMAYTSRDAELPLWRQQRKILDDTRESLHAAVAAQKDRDHMLAGKLLDQGLQLLGEPWGGESKRLQEDLERHRRASARALHRSHGVLSFRSTSPSPPRRTSKPASARSDAQDELQTGGAVARRSGRVKSNRDRQMFADDKKSETVQPTQQRARRRRPEAADVAESKYRDAVEASNRGDDEDALELVESGLELLPSSVSSDREEQKLRETMEEFRREKTALLEQSWRRRDQDHQPHHKRPPGAGSGGGGERGGRHGRYGLDADGEGVPGPPSTRAHTSRRATMKPTEPHASARTQPRDPLDTKARAERIKIKHQESLRKRRAGSVESILDTDSESILDTDSD